MSSPSFTNEGELSVALQKLLTTALAHNRRLQLHVDSCIDAQSRESECDVEYVEIYKRGVAVELKHNVNHPQVLQVMRDFPDPTKNPAVDFLTRARPPSLGGPTVPGKRSPSSTDKTELLRRNFFETPFVGEEHQLLATALFEYEKKVCAGYAACQARAPLGTYDLWYGRIVPIVQSSGMGKSRLMRELGQVKQIVEKKLEGRKVVGEAVHSVAITVFTLCLRDDTPGQSMCYPKTDAAVRDYLNEAEDDDPWLHELRIHSLFDAFWRAANQEKDRSPEQWLVICDPTTTSSDAIRSAFFENVIEDAKPIYADRKRRFRNNTPSHLCDSIAEVQAACRAYMETVHDNEWFVLALDEAAGMRPFLTTIGDQTAQQLALASLKRLFASTATVLDEMDAAANSNGADPPPRCWLLLADTNASILHLAPPVRQSASAREAKLIAERCPPYCPVTLNIALEDPWKTQRILCDLSPLAASSWSVITRTGRPLWGSELAEQQEVRASSPDLLKRPPTEEPMHRPTEKFVLLKLLAPDPLSLPKEQASTWHLTRPQYFALLYQRLQLLHPTGQHYDSQTPQSFRKMQESQVHLHLGVVIRLPRRSAELTVVTADEPLVAQIATGFMRTNGKGYLVNLERPIWDYALKDLRDFALHGYPLDQGASGEIDAQVMACICHDLAVRRPIPGFNKRNDPYHPTSAFVHLSDYLDQLTKLDCSGIVASFGKEAWITAQRFRRVSGKTMTTRRDLIIAHQGRYGILGGTNQQGWDIVIPVYCADLTQPRRHDAWSFIAIQVKNRRDARITEFNPPQFELGALHFPDEQPGGGQGNPEQMKPCRPPVLIWLNMMSVADRAGPTLERKKARKTAKATQDFWYLQFPAFNINNHPALSKIDSAHFPILTVDNTPLTEYFVPDAAVSQEQALEGARIFPDPYPIKTKESLSQKQQRTR